MGIKILLLIILIIINGIFAATEIAFLSLNKYELHKKIKEGNSKAVKILNLINDSSTFLSTIQITITLSGFLASAFAAENFASELASVITIQGITQETLTSILIVLITIILSYFTLVFGELVPKKIGMIYSEKIAYKMVGVINIVIKLLKPFIMILKSSVNFIMNILKLERKEDNNEDVIKDSIVESQLEDFEKNILFNVFEFDDKTVDKAMTPIKDVKSIDVNDSMSDILAEIKKYKYTRFPVTKDNKIIGVINIKDFVIKNAKNFSVKKHVKKLMKVSYDTITDDAYLLLTSKHCMMAAVEKDNEIIGIVTLEDIIEELIGNIYDEYN